MPQEKRSVSWVVLHSAVLFLSVISLVTGLRIAALTRPEVLHFSALLPQGYLHELHLLSASGLIAVIASYVILHRYEKTRRFKRGHFHHRVTQFSYLVFFVLTLSGLLLYFGSAMPAAEFHYYSALAFVLYFILHALVMFVIYGWTIFVGLVNAGKLRMSDLKVLGSGFAIASLVIVFQSATDKTLRIKPIPLESIIEIDGVADEEIWQQAVPITIHTHGGANFRDGMTPVTLRALHNGVEAFFHITWLDESESLQHLPLVKTGSAWRVIEDGFYRADEKSYYEDKFALMLANNCQPGASKTAHLGPKPLDNKPANWHAKGYHYAEDGKVRDIWHWKAVRTNDMYLADDNYFAAPDIVRSGLRRYTAGYLSDGKESGAYVMNWQWYRPRSVLPKRLPPKAGALDQYLSADDEPDVKSMGKNMGDDISKSKTQADEMKWVAPWYDYTLYKTENDTFPEGTLMPSVLHLSNRFEGDRADVRARGEWSEGRWSLELARPLNTHSDKDVALQTGVCLWVSAFDHAQIAHTRHTRPARIVIKSP